MTRTPKPNTETLLRQAQQGDHAARQQLLTRHRTRLRQMIALRLDHRLAPRVDPSDVVQEVLTVAAARLNDYLREPPLPFYPWLRQFAQDRLIELQRRHIQALKRTVKREEPWNLALPNESALELVNRLIDYDSSPGQRLQQAELRDRLHRALQQLGPRDQEILVLRHLEQLSTKEAAAVLGISEGAVKLRHLRALERLRSMWTTAEEGDQP